MKRLSGLSVLILLGMAGVAETKYVFPPDHQVKSRSEEIAEYQMKEYDKALPYALKALEYNGTIADRTSIMSTNEWVINEIDPSNIMYINSIFY